MKYFKDAQNNVYAYESDGSQDSLIAPSLIPITQSQANALTQGNGITDEDWNAIVDEQLMTADLKIIRALTEGDTARVNAHKAAQAALRATRR